MMSHDLIFWALVGNCKLFGTRINLFQHKFLFSEIFVENWHVHVSHVLKL